MRLYHLQCSFKYQRKKGGSELEPDTAFNFQKAPALHWRAKTYSAFSYDRRTSFQHDAFPFLFHFSCFCDGLLFFMSQSNLFVFNAGLSNPLTCACFRFPQTGSHIIINNLLASFSRPKRVKGKKRGYSRDRENEANIRYLCRNRRVLSAFSDRTLFSFSIILPIIVSLI